MPRRYKSKTKVIVPHTGYADDPVKTPAGYHFWCIGCKMHHSVSVRLWRKGGNPVWTFNGNEGKPTFQPSVLVTIRDEPRQTCHSFVTDGKIQFLGDCWHSLANQTVHLPPISDWPY